MSNDLLVIVTVEQVRNGLEYCGTVGLNGTSFPFRLTLRSVIDQIEVSAIAEQSTFVLKRHNLDGPTVESSDVIQTVLPLVFQVAKKHYQLPRTRKANEVALSVLAGRNDHIHQELWSPVGTSPLDVLKMSDRFDISLTPAISELLPATLAA